jgi:hypothetical protein
MLAPDPHAPANASDGAAGGLASDILNALRAGPLRERTLGREFPTAPFQTTVAELLRQRRIVRIGFTPTDLFCAEGRVPRFAQDDARRLLAIYARMVDMEPDLLSERLWDAIRHRVAAILIGFLAGLDSGSLEESRVTERLADLSTAEDQGPRLDIVPDGPIVLVGAGAPMMFSHVPASLREWLRVPAHGDVANALGAVASRFVWRESATLEPLRYGGVELFDHHGKRALPSLEEGLAEAKRVLEARLRERAAAEHVADPRVRFREEIIEEYADFSKRTRKELVLARVEAVLTGMPGEV